MVKKIPENFEDLYKQFVGGVISKGKLLDLTQVTERTLCRWRDKLNLAKTPQGNGSTLGKPPRKYIDEKFRQKFKAEFLRLHNKPKAKNTICRKLNIGHKTYKKLKNELIKQELSMEVTTEKKSVTELTSKLLVTKQEPSLKLIDSLSVEPFAKSSFTIKLFGYEISLSVKKAEPPELVSTPDELADFIEY